MRVIDTLAIAPAILAALAGCAQPSAAECPLPEPPGAAYRSPDQFELTRKVVCAVPGEGPAILIYSSCLAHCGRILEELEPYPDRVFPPREMVEHGRPDGFMAGDEGPAATRDPWSSVTFETKSLLIVTALRRASIPWI